MMVFADTWTAVSAVGTLVAAIAAAVAAGIAAYTTRLNRVTAEATVKSAQASEKAATANATAADLTRHQWEDEIRDRDEVRRSRNEGILLALRLQCEQVWSVWHHSVAILRTQRIGVWEQYATEIAVRYPDVAEKMKDAAIAVELTNWFIDMRHGPIPVEMRKENIGTVDMEVKMRHTMTNEARGAAQGAAIKLNEVVEAIKATQSALSRKEPTR